MTVASTVNTVNYAGAGTTGPFPITFKFFKDADIVATHVSTAGVETVLTITTHYTLTGAGDASGGALTLVSALASGEKLYIKRSPAITQETDYVENAAFSAETHEAALDLLTMIAQDNAEKISRAVLVDISSSTTPAELMAELAADVAAASASATDAETAKGLAEDAQAAAEAAAASVEIPVPVASGGTGATSASGARTALGLGTAATKDTGTASGNVPLLTTGGAMALAGQLDLSGASSGQIAFPATQNPSSDANTLDDYEEGTFTPTIIGTTAAGTGTYTTQSGAYVKIGKVVYCSIQLVTTAHTGTGNMRISGLPFTVGRTMAAVAGYIDALTITGVLGANAVAGESQLYLFSINNGTAALLALDAACAINVNFFYFV